MVVDQMVVDQIPVGQMVVDQMLVRQMAEPKMHFWDTVQLVFPEPVSLESF
jgi:hypothetical protein